MDAECWSCTGSGIIKNVKKSADGVETLLQVEAGGDALSAATMLFGALSHRSMTGVRDFLRAHHEKSTDSQRVDSMSSGLTRRDAKGRRPK
jgi:hypothetical protein